ncbi:MAG: hypothetical protein R6U35_04805 [Candidatus Humimicrobiaceae bacterium]
MKTKQIMLKGNWECGWALDLNTVCEGSEENDLLLVRRTEIGENLYQLKYFGNKEKVRVIGNVASNFIMKKIKPLGAKAIIPVPPSKLDRKFQPVYELSKFIGKKTGIPVDFDYLIKTRETPQLLNIEKGEERRKILKDIFKIKDRRYEGENLLLFDDLYSSGETLKSITEVLISEGKTSDIYVLTIAKTRVQK